MKISIVTVTLNSEKTLERTIKSVLGQNYSDVEYIIIDGGSTDGTLNIIEKYKDKISKVISEKDNGLYDAMNKGIKLSTGDIVGILNSDDFFYNEEVLSIVANSFEDKEIDAVYGDITYFADDVGKVTRYWRAGDYSERKLNNGWIIPHPSLFVRKSVYAKCGFFNLDFKIAADYEFILRLLKVYKIKVKYVPFVFTRMYNDGNSGKNFKQRMRGWKELKKAWSVNNFKIPKLFILRRLSYKIFQYF